MLSRSSIAFSLGLSLLLGLTSCTPANNTTPTETETSQNEVQSQQEIKISGGGAVYPAFKAIAAAYEAQNLDVKITFLPENQSSGGISAVKDGLVELGTVSRPPKSKEDAPNLVYRDLAKDALIVATHSSVEGVTDLTTDQIKGIYSGKITNWSELGGPDAAIVLLDRPEDESAKRLLRKYYLGADLPNADSAIILRYEGELVNTLVATPYSIGAFSQARAIDNNLNVNRLSLDGVEPSAENMETGTYAMVRTAGAVWLQDPPEHVQKFIDFVFSDKGGEAMKKVGYSPLKE
jgi:phosphate transport system substrate-binding protein